MKRVDKLKLRFPIVSLPNYTDIYHSVGKNSILVTIQRLNDKIDAFDNMEFEFPDGEITNIIGFTEEEAKYYHNEYMDGIASGGNITFGSEEDDVIEEIVKYWLENAAEQDEAIKAQAKSILMKIDSWNVLRDLEYEEAVAYIEKTGMKLECYYTPDEINKIVIIANYWLRNTVEKDKETTAYVNKILMKIDHWYLRALSAVFWRPKP